MNITIIANNDLINQALKASALIGFEHPLPGLNANLNAALYGMVASVWEKVEKSIKEASIYGSEKAKGFIEDAQLSIEQTMQKAGDYAEDLHTILSERMRAFMHSLWTNALAQMPGETQFGARLFAVSAFTFTQKIKFGGKLETNLFKICEIVSEGEFEIEVEYGLASTTAPAS